MSTLTSFLLNNVAERMTPILQTPVEDIIYEVLDRKGLPTRTEVRDLKGRLEKLEQSVQGLSGTFDALRKEVQDAIVRARAIADAARASSAEAASAGARAEAAVGAARAAVSSPGPAPVAEAPSAQASPAPAVRGRPRRAEKSAAPATATPAEGARKAGRPRGEPSECVVPGCERGVRSKGFCPAHYQTWRRGRLDLFVSPDGLLFFEGRQVSVGEDLAGERAAVSREGDELLIQVGGRQLRRGGGSPTGRART